MPSPIDLSRIIRPAIKPYNNREAVPDDEDCHSTASTVLVDHPLFDQKKKEERSSTSPSTAKKSVQFSTEPSQYHDPTISVLTPELVAECWYHLHEIQTFRQQVIALTQHVVQFERLNRAPFSYQRVLERTFNDSCGCRGVRPSEADDDAVVVVAGGGSENQQHLQRWLEVADCRLGLERLCVAKIARDKTKRRVALQRLMRQERRRRQQQQEQKILDNGNNNLAVLSEDKKNQDRAEWLREECDRYSRPSRVFARTMAEALAAVIRNEEREASFLLPSAITFLSPASAGIEV